MATKSTSAPDREADPSLRVGILLEGLEDRDRCPVAGEKARKTKCCCLRDLMLQQQPELHRALTSFLVQFEKKKSPEARRNWVNKHAYKAEEGGLICLNLPFNRHYSLPVPEPSKGSAVILCRSATIEISRRYLGWKWDDTETYFSTLQQLARLKKKWVICRVLCYLLERNFVEGGNLSWQHESFVDTKIKVKTAMKYVGDFQLRGVALSVVKCARSHTQWVTDICRGHVVDLPETVLREGIPKLVRRGQVANLYDFVDKGSVGWTKALYPKRVQYRTIDPSETSDHQSKVVLESMKDSIAQALGTTASSLKLEGSFLKSLGHAPQVPHFDFTDRVLEEHRNKLYIAVTPLTKAGSYLQVWPIREERSPGEVIFIPFGVLLILPGDTIHGGGFQSCFMSLDLRLHLYIFVNSSGGVRNENVWLCEDQYPMNDDLLEGGKLQRIFSSDAAPARTSTKKQNSTNGQGCTNGQGSTSGQGSIDSLDLTSKPMKTAVL